MKIFGLKEILVSKAKIIGKPSRMDMDLILRTEAIGKYKFIQI